MREFKVQNGRWKEGRKAYESSSCALVNTRRHTHTLIHSHQYPTSFIFLFLVSASSYTHTWPHPSSYTLDLLTTINSCTFTYFFYFLLLFSLLHSFIYYYFLFFDFLVSASSYTHAQPQPSSYTLAYLPTTTSYSPTFSLLPFAVLVNTLSRLLFSFSPKCCVQAISEHHASPIHSLLSPLTHSLQLLSRPYHNSHSHMPSCFPIMCLPHLRVASFTFISSPLFLFITFVTYLYL